MGSGMRGLYQVTRPRFFLLPSFWLSSVTSSASAQQRCFLPKHLNPFWLNVGSLSSAARMHYNLYTITEFQHQRLCLPPLPSSTAPVAAAGSMPQRSSSPQRDQGVTTCSGRSCPVNRRGEQNPVPLGPAPPGGPMVDPQPPPPSLGGGYSSHPPQR
jgi:hypothetical protein